MRRFRASIQPKDELRDYEPVSFELNPIDDVTLRLMAQGKVYETYPKLGTFKLTLDEVVIRYTTAPQSYDGFGTQTVEVLPNKNRKGENVRKVELLLEHLTWQTIRYASGLYGVWDEESWKDVKTLKEYQVDAETLKCSTCGKDLGMTDHDKENADPVFCSEKCEKDFQK